MTKLTPAQYVILMFGGVRKTAKILKRNPGSISRWNATKKQGGSSGRVPESAWFDILKHAKTAGLPITETHLVAGKTISR